MKVKFDKPATQPEIDDGIKIEYAPAKRVFPLFRWYLILLIVASPVIYFIGTIIADKFVIKANGFVSLNLVQVRSPHEGRIASLDIAPWDVVAKDQPLTSIELPRHVVSQLALAQRNREQAQSDRLRAQGDQRKAKIEQYKETKRKAKLTQAAAQARLLTLNQSLSLSKEQLEHHKKRYAGILKLTQYGAATAAESAQAKQQLDNAKRQTFNDVAAIEKEKLSLINVESLLASAAYPGAQALQDTTLIPPSKEQLNPSSDSIVVSPIAGRVVEILSKENQYLQAGESILVIAPMREGYITAYLEARHSQYAKIGQSARIRIAKGEALDARIVALPKVAKKLPAEFANAFGVRPLTIVVQLQTDAPLPINHQIHGLPVDISFQPKLLRWLETAGL